MWFKKFTYDWVYPGMTDTITIVHYRNFKHHYHYRYRYFQNTDSRTIVDFQLIQKGLPLILFYITPIILQANECWQPCSIRFWSLMNDNICTKNGDWFNLACQLPWSRFGNKDLSFSIANNAILNIFQPYIPYVG